MSTLPQQKVIDQYLADGAEDTYIYSYLILDADDLAVYVTPDGQEANPAADIVDPGDYSVTGVGVVSGGTVIFNVPPLVNSIVTIVRNMQLTLTTNFAVAQTFNGANMDLALQRIVMMVQQLQGNYNVNATTPNTNQGPVGSISRCLQYVVDSYLPNALPNILPKLTDIDNQVWMSQGGGIVAALLQNDNMSTLRSQLADENMGTAGSTLVGFYDETNLVPQTVYEFLNNLPTFINNLNYVDAARLQAGYAISANDTGAVNALVVTLSPALTAYAAYNRFYVKVAVTNTGAATIDVNGLGAKAITYMDTSALNAGAMIAGAVAELVYDGTRFLLMNPFVRPATGAEAIGSTDGTHPITALAAAFGLSTKGVGALPNGYVTLPGGLILQWGTTTGTIPGGTATFTFPIVFPTNVLTYSVTPFYGAGIATTTDFNVRQVNNAGIGVNSSASNIENLDFQYFAIGY